MEVSKEFVKLCGQVGNFTSGITGVSLVDAYFGPDELNPELQEFDGDTQSLTRNLRNLIDLIREEVNLPLRQEYMIGEVESMLVVVDWLSGEKMSYPDLVQGLFGIAMKRFDDSMIDDCIASLEAEIEGYLGADLREKVTNFTKEGEVTGEELRELVEGELQNKSSEVGQLFRERVFSKLGEKVQDNGVVYEAVTDKPWSGYNWYQGGFKSLNQFNVDNTFNAKTIRSVIYHEYEHHVSNLWREKNFLDSGNLELSIVPLHTGRCVISEGTADTAKDFLGVEEDDPAVRVMTELYRLRRITSINAAIMLNQDGRSEEEAVEYMVENGYRTQKAAKSSVRFIGQTTEHGRKNFWAPYIFTYFIGRQDFVFPTFLKAKEQGEIGQFFRTVYLNPYAGSSLTWNRAFEWL
ncbi:hypothetical protein EU546_05340 [Candidatus Thorarchaeota archaeon]|nr:MAG: hypothetical protein EU546_05340 [Candidatus Thorarchaeota archaeon]